MAIASLGGDILNKSGQLNTKNFVDGTHFGLSVPVQEGMNLLGGKWKIFHRTLGAAQ